MKLSRRQTQLLGLLKEGMNNQEIADHLGISVHTVKVHFWRLYQQIGVKSRAQAVCWAAQQINPAQWIGLTNEQFAELHKKHSDRGDAMREVAALLKAANFKETT